MIDNLYKKHNIFKIILGIIFLLIYATGTVLAGGSIVGLLKFIVGCTGQYTTPSIWMNIFL